MKREIHSKDNRCTSIVVHYDIFFSTHSLLTYQYIVGVLLINGFLKMISSFCNTVMTIIVTDFAVLSLCGAWCGLLDLEIILDIFKPIFVILCFDRHKIFTKRNVSVRSLQVNKYRTMNGILGHDTAL